MSKAKSKQLGRYKLVAELGRGAMGVVYKAEDPLLNRTVAIKTILLMDDPAARAEYEARFFQEAKAAGGLNHPNLITIHDIGREGDVAYMAMELLEGTELREMMAKGRLPLPFALDVAAQVADGLAHAHANGVVHRDIKPANIMIMRDRRAKIMDFGIARVRASDIRTQTGSILGSPKYLSPEQAAGQSADFRSDIFSLGVVLHELAAGEPPFSASSVAQLLQQITTATPRPPSAANRSIPAVLDLIVAKALDKQPDGRYQSAAEFAADVRACLAQLPARQGERADAGEATMVAESAPPTAAAVDFVLEGTRDDNAAPATGAAAAFSATLVGQGLSLPLSRRFDSTEAFLLLTGPAADAKVAAVAKGKLPLSLRIRTALNREQLEPAWPVFAAAVLVAMAFAFLIAYSP
jgi:eukaryotic-like serine/threonine-protein kinase